MRQAVLWAMVAYWFLHLAIGAGSGYAIMRLWANRTNPFIWRVALYMHAAVIGLLVAVVLPFMARGVKLTWKFAIVWFAGNLLMDMVRVPLILYLCLGGESRRKPESVEEKLNGK